MHWAGQLLSLFFTAEGQCELLYGETNLLTVASGRV